MKPEFMSFTELLEAYKKLIEKYEMFKNDIEALLIKKEKDNDKV
jgi:hypothetical protein